MFQRSVPLEGAVGDKMMRGVSDAQLRSGGEGFPGGLRDREVGCERHNFIEASREKLPTLMKRLS